MLEELVGKVLKCECNERSDTCHRETGGCLVTESFLSSSNLTRFISYFRNVHIILEAKTAKHALKDIMDILMKNVLPARALQ